MNRSNPCAVRAVHAAPTAAPASNARAARRLLVAAVAAGAVSAYAPGQESPPDCNANALGASLIPTIEGVPVPAGSCVIPGQEIDYVASLFVIPNDPNKPDLSYCDVEGGQLSVTLPDWEALPLRRDQYVPTAGYPTTDPMSIPAFGNADGADMLFIVPVPQVYIVDAAHANALGFLNARVDYGQTAYLDEIGEMQENAIVLSNPPEEGTASVSQAMPLCVPAIELEKSADPRQICDGVPTEVTFTFAVTNTSSSVAAVEMLPDLTNVAIADPDCEIINGPFGDDGDGLLNAGETWTYTCTTTLSEATTNTAEVSAVAIAAFPTGLVVDTVEYSDTATADVTAVPTPVAAASNSGPACAGDAVQLFAEGKFAAYEWTGPEGFTSKKQNPTVDPVVFGEYCVTVTDRNGCTDTACTQVEPGDCAGACCFEDGSCVELDEADCLAQGGTWQGLGTACEPDTCPPGPGACCFEDGSCIETTPDDCTAQGGVPQAEGSTCDPNPCPPPPGACCFEDGSCTILAEKECLAQGGVPQGPGSTCDPNPCPPPPGACCFDDGSCIVVDDEGCLAQGGTPQGTGTTCDPNPCPPPPPPGACCLSDGSCAELTEDECLMQGGAWQGPDTVCDPDPCAAPEACCFNDGTCQLLDADECAAAGGQAQGDGTSCDDVECPRIKGACCLPWGGCVVTPESSCTEAGGEYLGDLTICVPFPCTPPTGGCCLPDGSCVELNQSDCHDEGGLWQGANTDCAGATCVDDGDACCLPDGSCVELSQSDCAEAGGLYQGAGTDCEDAECPVLQGACCLDDGTCIDGLTSDECGEEGGTYQGNGTACDDSSCVDPVGSCCEFGKPRSLTMQYTGDDCSATSHSQDDGKVECDDFGPLADTVFIRASDDDDPDDTDSVWFEGEVELDALYVIDAANAGEDKLKSATFVHIFDVDGNLLQSVEFHTSCSQPLEGGDQFGASLLVDCEGEDEPIEGSCCEFGKPRLLGMQYTGDDCSATTHAQDPDKVSCDDFGMLPETVHIIANDDDDPDDDDNVWFEGSVSLGEIFEIDAHNAGESKLKSATWIHVFGPDGNLLQQVEFHTSCSQPLAVDDQFGAALLVECLGEDQADAASGSETGGAVDDGAAVGVDAVVEIILNWGACPAISTTPCRGDVDGDGVVGVDDLVAVLQSS